MPESRPWLPRTGSDVSRRLISPSWESAAWMAIGVIVTVALIPARARIGTGHVAFVYLLLVLFASARRGRRLGLALAAASFLGFNYFFVPPYGTLSVDDPLDWIVLFAFLATGAVAAQLLHRAQSEAAAAKRGAFELQRLATLGAEALQSARAVDAAAAISRVIREELGVDACELYLRDSSTEQMRIVARASATSTQGFTDDAGEFVSAAGIILASDATTFLLPLHARTGQVGLLRLKSQRVISPDIGRQPFFEALAYYAALGLERIRLSAAAEQADALREADKLKDALLAGVSHDLRTPLTSIKAIAREIAEGGDARGTVVELEADRLNRYVSNLLDLSRLNAGAIRVVPELIPIEDLLGAALQQVAAVIGDRNVHMDLGVNVPMLIGRFDFVLTLRALGNVIENAARYSPDGTPIEIRAYAEQGLIRIEVADHGPGIPVADRERVFAPFQRVAVVQDAERAGLGLSIARQVLEAQNGSLTFRPVPTGGALFTISLPASEAPSFQASL